MLTESRKTRREEAERSLAMAMSGLFSAPVRKRKLSSILGYKLDLVWNKLGWRAHGGKILAEILKEWHRAGYVVLSSSTAGDEAKLGTALVAVPGVPQGFYQLDTVRPGPQWWRLAERFTAPPEVSTQMAPKTPTEPAKRSRPAKARKPRGGRGGRSRGRGGRG